MREVIKLRVAFLFLKVHPRNMDMKSSVIVRKLSSLFVVYGMLGLASVCSAQTSLPAGLNVRLVADEAEAVLAVLSRKKTNQPITEGDWCDFAFD